MVVVFLKNFLKEHKLFIKYYTLAVLGTSAGWVYYQINKTKNVLENALDTSVLQLRSVEQNHHPHNITKEEIEDDELVEIEPFLEYKKGNISQWFFNNLKFAYARRLLSVSKDSNKYYRLKAVNNLAKMHYLDDWHCVLIANMLDARTVVALARTSGADKRLFLAPPYRYHNYNHDQLINAMREFLISVYEKSQHPCMGYFLSKVFIYEDDSERLVDDDTSSMELIKYIQTEKEVLPLCLESLLHHCSVEEYSKDIAELNGLPLLMEIHKRYSKDVNVTIKLCQIVSYMSYNRQLLESFWKSGWISVLANWTNHEDIRVSIPAARALANLDADHEPQYSSNLYILHPVNRTKSHHHVDVVFVHGLLGGIFYTWRQRLHDHDILGLLGKKNGKETIMPDVNTPLIRKNRTPRKRTFAQYFKDLREKIVSDDYEIVWNDIPLHANEDCKGPFTCTEETFFFDKSLENDDSYTYCWPKDWLGEDCKNVRIIGINYDTSLSMWAPLCPLVKEKLTIDERSDAIAQKLLQCGIGDKPIVWIAHSMGGLIVKNILVQSHDSKDPKIKGLSENTKAVVFYSTPHRGSKVANISNAVSLVLWPSVEVQELKENSPQLTAIHDKFLKLANDIPVRVLTFVETKATVVTAMKINLLMVDPHSGNTGIGEYYEIPQNHLEICKPHNRYSFLYQKVLHLILDVLNKHDHS